jgi:tetratricopeptide (TPR) repeat protein
LCESKEYVDGSIHFSRAIELDPHNPIYYVHRADAYDAQHLTELAQKDYKMVLAIDKNFLQPYYELRKRYEVEGNKAGIYEIDKFMSKIIYLLNNLVIR